MSLTMKVGLQLFTLKEDMATDFIGTLEKVAAMGYEGVEFAGYGDFSAEELRNHLDRLGMVTMSTHVSLKHFEEDFNKQIHFAKVLGMDVITVPYLPETMRTSKEDYVNIAKRLQALGEACVREGIQFCYHNHGFEFKQYDGMYGLDIILDNTTSEALKLELDTFWVQYADVNPIEYLNKWQDRVHLIHIKDMVQDQPIPYVAIGEGIMDITGIVKAAKDIGIEWAIVEQDKSLIPAIESVNISITNLRKMGIC